MLNRPVILAAFTPRSQAYVQAMAAAHFSGLTVIAYGDPTATPVEYTTEAARDGLRNLRGVKLPDLSEPIEVTCRKAGWQFLQHPDRDLGSRALVEVLAACRPSLVIFSGYGGQIVGRDMLEAGAPFLHAHAGLLPDYRGSTTLYYSVLERRACAASALFLRTGIDTGPVIVQCTYPLPPRGMDVDRLYDGAIRADILIRALNVIRQKGSAVAVEHGAHEGHTYFVIHPVLKHLAMLSLPSAQASEEAWKQNVDANAA